MDSIEIQDSLKTINPDNFLPYQIHSRNRIYFDFLDTLNKEIIEFISSKKNKNVFDKLLNVISDNPFNLNGIIAYSHSNSGVFKNQPRFLDIKLYGNNGFIQFDYEHDGRLIPIESNIYSTYSKNEKFKAILSFFSEYQEISNEICFTNIKLAKSSKLKEFINNVVTRKDYFKLHEYDSKLLETGITYIESLIIDENLPRYLITKKNNELSLANMYMTINK